MLDFCRSNHLRWSGFCCSAHLNARYLSCLGITSKWTLLYGSLCWVNSMSKGHTMVKWLLAPNNFLMNHSSVVTDWVALGITERVVKYASDLWGTFSWLDWSLSLSYLNFSSITFLTLATKYGVHSQREKGGQRERGRCLHLLSDKHVTTLHKFVATASNKE